MKVMTKLKLYACTSFRDCEQDNDYCPNCSHAIYKGSATVNGRKYTWEHNPYHGPLFACKQIGKKEWLPNERHPVWDSFQKWYDKNFKFEKEDRDEAGT